MAKQFLCKVIGHDYDISIIGDVGGSLRVVADQCTRCGHTTRSLRPEAIIQAIRPANDKYGRIHTDGSRSGGQPVVDNEMLEALQKDAGIPHLPTQETYQFRMAVSGEGPLAHQWADKPHRLLYDACSIIESEAAQRQPTQSDALQADALDFGNELIFACAGLRHEPVDTEAIFSITWDGLPYDVTIRAAQEQST